MTTHLTTTIAEIRGWWPCAGGFGTLLAARPNMADDVPVTLESILDSNGEADCRWTLAKMGEPGARALRAYGTWCALQVLPIYERRYPGDRRPREAVEAAQRFLAHPTPENRAAMRDKRAAADAAAAYADAAAAVAAYAAAAAADAAADAVAAAVAVAVARLGMKARQLVALRHICRGEYAALDTLGNKGHADA